MDQSRASSENAAPAALLATVPNNSPSQAAAAQVPREDARDIAAADSVKACDDDSHGMGASGDNADLLAWAGSALDGVDTQSVDSLLAAFADTFADTCADSAPASHTAAEPALRTPGAADITPASAAGLLALGCTPPAAGDNADGMDALLAVFADSAPLSDAAGSPTAPAAVVQQPQPARAMLDATLFSTSSAGRGSNGDCDARAEHAQNPAGGSAESNPRAAPGLESLLAEDGAGTAAAAARDSGAGAVRMQRPAAALESSDIGYASAFDYQRAISYVDTGSPPPLRKRGNAADPTAAFSFTAPSASSTATGGLLRERRCATVAAAHNPTAALCSIADGAQGGSEGVKGGLLEALTAGLQQMEAGGDENSGPGGVDMDRLAACLREFHTRVDADGGDLAPTTVVFDVPAAPAVGRGASVLVEVRTARP